MTSNYSMGYRYGVSSTLANPHMMSFQSGAMNTSTSLTYNPVGLPSGQPNMVGTSSNVVRTGDPGPSNVLTGAVPGLKWNPGLAQVWSDEEDALLIGGLSKFGNESPMSKYVKIAATLSNKSVRDVALRCQWLNEKRRINRRKPEDHHVKKLKDRKEKVIASQANAHMAPYNKATYSERTQSKVPVVDFVTQQLLDDNNHLIRLISSNSVNIQQSFGLVQIKRNAALLSRLMNNIIIIQHRMSQSALLSHMPPLPALKEGSGMFLQKVANMNSLYDGLACNQLQQ
ncbi:putative transcription factor MYB-HB-like family [Dioscorea sansibarensis]